MKKIAVILLMLPLVYSSYGQNVGKMDFKAGGFTQKKFNNAEKKIYLQHFIVNYQTVMVSWAKARGGVTYGSAEAALALGLDGVTNEQLQQMTDRYYDDFVQKLTSAGFTIMSTDEVQANEHFADWGKVEGGSPTMDAVASGYLTTIPSNFTQLDGGGSIFNLAGAPESKKLGGVIVARVYVTVPFAEAQSTNGGLVGGVAKVTAKADLRLSPMETIPVKGDFKKPKRSSTAVTFMYKESLKWQALSQGELKKPIEIEGVLDEKKKYKATSISTSTTRSGFRAKYSNEYSKNAQLVECDPTKYEKGVNEAVSQYLNTSVDGFLSYIK